MEHPDLINDFTAKLINELQYWNRKHIDQEQVIVIRRQAPKAQRISKPGKVNFSERCDERLDIFSAIFDLRDVLYGGAQIEIRKSSDQLAKDQPDPKQAAKNFEMWLLQVVGRTMTFYKEQINRLVEIKTSTWDDSGTGVSDDEMGLFEQGFELSLQILVSDEFAHFVETIGIPTLRLSNTNIKKNLRQEMFRRFIVRCRDQIQLEIQPEHIWRAAKHKHPRQFQYWLAGTDCPTGQKRGATHEDNRNFWRFLRMEPSEFQSRLVDLKIAVHPKTRKNTKRVRVFP